MASAGPMQICNRIIRIFKNRKVPAGQPLLCLTGKTLQFLNLLLGIDHYRDKANLPILDVDIESVARDKPELID